MSLGKKIIVASHNAGKVREMNELLGLYGVEAISAGVLGLPEPVEDGDSFIANAQIKAKAAAKAAALPALSDDSGLVVDALDGAPGIYSARWAGPTKDFKLAMAAIEQALKKNNAHPPYHAHFVCALCLAFPDGTDQAFEGHVYGQLVFPPRGQQGFGYDPIFLPDGEKETFGEMSPARKHAMSHRADAFQQLTKAVFEV